MNMPTRKIIQPFDRCKVRSKVDQRSRGQYWITIADTAKLNNNSGGSRIICCHPARWQTQSDPHRGVNAKSTRFYKNLLLIDNRHDHHSIRSRTGIWLINIRSEKMYNGAKNRNFRFDCKSKDHRWVIVCDNGDST